MKSVLFDKKEEFIRESLKRWFWYSYKNQEIKNGFSRNNLEIMEFSDMMRFNIYLNKVSNLKQKINKNMGKLLNKFTHENRTDDRQL